MHAAGPGLRRLNYFLGSFMFCSHDGVQVDTLGMLVSWGVTVCV